MSTIPLSGALGITLGMFSIQIAVQDVSYTASGGIDVQSVPANRTINGMADPTNTRKMEYIFGGNVSEGDLLLYTSELLYVDDMYDPNSGLPRKQSFVTYSATQYRVSDFRDWRTQAGVYVYLCKRHIAQGGGI